MEIKINDQFYLRTDPHNFIIAIKDKDGKFDNIAYYNNLEQTLNRLIDKRLMKSTIKTLEELKDEIQKIRNEIIELLVKKNLF